MAVFKQEMFPQFDGFHPVSIGVFGEQILYRIGGGFSC